MRRSAGLLLYKFNGEQREYFLVHPGGPFWQFKDNGAWSIPKGEYSDDEDPLETAIREFKEETGQSVEGIFIPLTPVKQKAGKVVVAFAIQGNADADKIKSNTYKMEWPSKSGKWISIPEVDKAGWFDKATAKQKINPAQAAFIDELEEIINQSK